ncbi:MAG TPA: TlpA disulfide reductase family protein [Acidimicrobiia bacterium]|nr:TlpA disulfide reductase family protein [Acidimicrobiia bacterium]
MSRETRAPAPRPAPRRPARPVERRAAPASRRDRRWFWWAALAGLLVVAGVSVALTAGGGGSSGKLEVAPSVTVDGSALPTYGSSSNDPAVGRTAPALTGKDFARKAVAVTNNGNPHVLVFVAHWCPHCQAEVPRIVAMERSGQTAGVSVVAVATATNENAANYPPSAWLRSTGWPYPVLVDTAKGTAANAYGLSAYPYLVFVDASGKVAARTAGEIAPSDLARMFSALAAGRPVPIPASAAASEGAG